MTATTPTTDGKTIVPASEVRAWAEGRGISTGSRGRLSAETIEQFNKAHRSKAYVAPRGRS